eukprot:6132114-Prymnesium_polylepis.1
MQLAAAGQGPEFSQWAYSCVWRFAAHHAQPHAPTALRVPRHCPSLGPSDNAWAVGCRLAIDRVYRPARDS